MTGKFSCHGHGVDHFPSPNSPIWVSILWKAIAIFTHFFLLFRTNKSPLFCGDVFLISSHDGEIPRVWSLSPNLSWSNPKFSLLNRNCSWVYKSRFLMVKSHFLMVKSHFFMVSPWFFSLPSLGGFARTKAIAWKLHQQHMDLARRSELLPGINWINSLPMGKKSSF